MRNLAPLLCRLTALSQAYSMANSAPRARSTCTTGVDVGFCGIRIADNAHYVKRRDGARSEDRIVYRHMRKLAERASYVRKTVVYRSSIDYQTGEVKTRKRRVSRRTKWMNGQAGFITVRDGAAVAADIARLLTYYSGQSPSPSPAQPRFGPDGRL